ncbi:MAG TPA: cytochrome c peroxidase [Bradyrhizobium sp.]|nr:cytochrome c peroxidase [Bradyrhizobium sp.]
MERIFARVSARTAISRLDILLGICCWLFAGLLASCGGAWFSGVTAAVAPPQVHAAGNEEPITPIPAPPIADPWKLALGERLFSDPRLSADGDLACSSCHDLHTNGADGIERQVRKDGSRPPFDTLTVFNAALSFRLTWKGRFRDLAEQAEASIDNPADMHSNLTDVARKLGSDPEMVWRFRVAYEQLPDRDNILDALTTFERSLLTPDSRFDRWLRGDASALTPRELEGYNTFKSLGCISCHQGVNVGGNLFQRLGVFHSLTKGPPRIMRVPSLRNVATTPPYFHDGSAATLEEAVRRMASAQLDRTLTDEQIESVVSFLKTLTGNYRGKPVVGRKS